MKKLLALLLSVVFMLSMSVTAFAYEYDDYYSEGETTLQEYVYSSFNLVIPATIDLSQGNGEISVTDADFDADYQLEVVVTNLTEDGLIEMTHTTKEGETAYCSLINGTTQEMLNNDNPLLATIKDTDIVDGAASVYFSGDIITKASAGTYTGTMTYTVYFGKY